MSGILYGDDGWKRDAEERERAAARKMGGDDYQPFRFFQKVGDSAYLLFLDDPIAFVEEHGLYQPGASPPISWHTCGMDFFGKCPLCDGAKQYPDKKAGKSLTLYGSVLNLTGYRNKKGEEVKMAKNLIQLKAKVRAKVPDKKALAGGSMAWSIWKFTRYDKQSGTGEDFDFIKKVSPADLQADPELMRFLPQGIPFEDFIQPFDYGKILAPQSLEALEDAAKRFFGGGVTSYSQPAPAPMAAPSLVAPSEAPADLVSPPPAGMTGQDIRSLL